MNKNTIHNMILRASIMLAFEAVVMGWLLIPDIGRVAGVIEALGAAYIVFMAAVNSDRIVGGCKDEH